MIGDVGFDPLRLAEVQVDLNYARGAEIKHGRIAMLVRFGLCHFLRGKNYLVRITRFQRQLSDSLCKSIYTFQERPTKIHTRVFPVSTCGYPM